MLDEYVTDLKTTLIERRSREQQLLNVGGANDDRIRGRLEAYDKAIADADEMLRKYAAPEEMPESVQRYERDVTATGRRIGGRRVA